MQDNYWCSFAKSTTLAIMKEKLNGMVAYYALATPTDTEITNEALVAQLEAILSQGSTYAGTNNITTVISEGNAQGELEICYTKTLLPIATETNLGLVQIGSGLSITPKGVLSADAESITVDSALSTSSPNPVQNSVITAALNEKANSADLSAVATSGSYNDLSNKPTIPTVNNGTLTIKKNGTTVQTFTANQSSNATANIIVPTQFSDLSGTVGTSLIADGAITQAKIGSDIEVGEVILDYVQAEDSSSADKAVIALDWSKYRKIVIDVNYVSNDSSTRWDEIVFYEADGNTSTYVRRTGVQMDKSTTVSGYRQNSNAGSVASTHAYGVGEGHLRATITNITHTFEQVQTASFADTEATYQAALDNNYYWNRLGGYYVDAAVAKVDRRSWLAGSYLKVIGYR